MSSTPPENSNPANLPTERAKDFLRQPIEGSVTPRNALQDSFEQNPAALTTGNTPLAPQDKIREAVRRVVEEGQTVEQVAKELKVSPSSVLRWRKQYFLLLAEEEREAPQEKAWTELNSNVGVEDHGLETHEVVKFTDNWHRLMKEQSATDADFKQHPWDVWLQNSEWTNWMYNAEGRIEKSNLVGVLFLILAVLAVFMVLMLGKPAGIAPTSGTVVTENQVLWMRDEMNLEKANAVVKDFLAQDSWITRLHYVRHPERLKPEIQRFFEKIGDKAYKNVVPNMGFIGKEDSEIIAVSADINELGETHYFNVVVIPDAKDALKLEYLIDWESSTLFQRPNLENFIKEASPEPKRLWLRLVKDNSYYNRDFSDSAVYDCYTMTYPGMSFTLYGYVKKDSEPGLALHIATMLGQEPGVILEARYPKNVKDRLQVEIIKLVADRWITQNPG